MAPEIQKTQGKTPEQIAQALDKSAQTLEEQGKALDAARKKEVAKKVRGLHTETELQSLTRTLSIPEKKDMQEAGFVGEVAIGAGVVGAAAFDFQEPMAASGGSVSQKVGAENFQKLMKESEARRTFIEKSVLEAAKAKGTELDFMDKIMLKVTAFAPAWMLSIMTFFDILPEGLTDVMDKWEKGEGREQKKEEVKGEGEKEEVKEREKTGDYKYVATTKAFVGFYYEREPKDKNKVQDVFLQGKFQELTFTDAMNHYNSYLHDKNSYQLKEKIGIEGNIQNDIIFKALELVATGKSRELLEKKFSSSLKDTSNLGSEKIGVLIHGLHEDIAHFGDILGMVPDSPEDIKKYVGLSVSKTSNGQIDISGPLKAKTEALGLSKDIIVYMDLISPGKSLGKIEDLMKQIQAENQISSGDLDVLRDKILPFAHAMQSEIIGNKQINLGMDFSQTLGNAPLEFSEILKLYIVTGGKTTFSSMNSFEKLGVYAFMIGASNDRGENMQGGGYSYKFGEELFKKTNSLIPDEVKSLGVKIFDAAGESIWNSLGSAAAWTAGVAEQNPVAAATVLAIFVFGKWLPKRDSIYNMAWGK